MPHSVVNCYQYAQECLSTPIPKKSRQSQDSRLYLQQTYMSRQKLQHIQVSLPWSETNISKSKHPETSSASIFPASCGDHWCVDATTSISAGACPSAAVLPLLLCHPNCSFLNLKPSISRLSRSTTKVPNVNTRKINPVTNHLKSITLLTCTW